MHGVVKFVEDCGSFVGSQFQSLERETREEVVRSIGCMFLSLFVELINLRAMRDTENAPDGSLVPPILPCDLLRMSPNGFFALIASQRERLLVSKPAQFVENLEQDFLEFRRTYANSTFPGVAAISANVHGGCIFEKAWKT